MSHVCVCLLDVLTVLLFGSVFVDTEETHSMKHGKFGHQNKAERRRVDSKVINVILCVETCKEKSEKKQVFNYVKEIPYLKILNTIHYSNFTHCVRLNTEYLYSNFTHKMMGTTVSD